MRNRRPRQIHDFWMSYSDMMAGLLLVFVLLLVVFVTQTKAKQAEQQAAMEKFRAGEARNHALQTRLTALHEDVGQLLKVRNDLKRRLNQEFAHDEVVGVTLDPATAAVRLGDTVLFGQNSAVLTASGKATLKEVVPRYVDALLGDEVLRASVEQIVFEGHTSSEWDARLTPDQEYLHNLKLSQQRAYNALEFVVSDPDIAREISRRLGREDSSLHDLKHVLAAIGYSSSRTLCSKEALVVRCDELSDAQAQRAHEDKPKSRRLEIGFRLKDEQAMVELDKLLTTTQ